jgi:hypothetical protein
MAPFGPSIQSFMPGLDATPPFNDTTIVDQSNLIGSNGRYESANIPPAIQGTIWSFSTQAPGLQPDQAPPVLAALLAQDEVQSMCTQPGCHRGFKRDTDRIRHEASIHGINQGVYLCHVPGCRKSHGKGFSRKDKLTEHLWKHHADLGFVKRT